MPASPEDWGVSIAPGTGRSSGGWASGDITALVLRVERLWGHEDVTIPAAAIVRIADDTIHLTLAKGEIAEEVDQQRDADVHREGVLGWPSSISAREPVILAAAGALV